MWKTFWEDWVMGGGGDIYTRLLELPNVLKRSAANYYIQSNLLTSCSKLLKLQPKLFFCMKSFDSWVSLPFTQTFDILYLFQVHRPLHHRPLLHQVGLLFLKKKKKERSNYVLVR